MVKYLKLNDLANQENFVKVATTSEATTKDMLDYIKPVVRKKPNTLIIHTGPNDLINGVKTMIKVKKLVQYIRENDKGKNIQIGFSSICYRADRVLEKEMNDTTGRLKNYCSGNGFIFTDNSTINESCLDNFVDCELFLESNFPDILALSETILDDLIDSGNFSVRIYLPLIRKDSITNMNGLAVYVKEGLLQGTYLQKTLQILT